MEFPKNKQIERGNWISFCLIIFFLLVKKELFPYPILGGMKNVFYIISLFCGLLLSKYLEKLMTKNKFFNSLHSILIGFISFTTIFLIATYILFLFKDYLGE
jgi:hypothetical protein